MNRPRCRGDFGSEGIDLNIAASEIFVGVNRFGALVGAEYLR